MAIVGASNALVLHNTISKNTANIGAAFELFAAANVTLENNKIVSNAAGTQGGGLWIVNESDEIIVQNIIAKNTAPSGSQKSRAFPVSIDVLRSMPVPRCGACATCAGSARGSSITITRLSGFTGSGNRS